MNSNTDTTACYDLSDLGVAHVSGDDAETFLQGQLSNDVTDIAPKAGHQLTAYSNPKGRMLALFNLLKKGDNSFLLLAPREILDKVLPRLKMFVMRAAVTIETDDTLRVIGVQTVDRDAAAAKLAPGTPCFTHSLDPNRHLAVAPGLPEIELLSRESWNRLDIEQNLPQVYLQTHEALIPQSVNLDIVGGVNFKKGCYPGQEIIARVKYRGKPKTRMIGASVKDVNTIEIGQPVYIEERDKAAGLVANLAVHGDTTLLSITVPVTHLHEGTLYLDEALSVPLERLPLPYEITV